MKGEKIDSIMMDIYRVLYRNSTPPADFDELVANATINERGEKEIDFMAYSIDQKLFDELMGAELKKHRIQKYYKELIRRSIYLGCSPKSIYE